ncbi:MAG: hypothetical protein WEB89_08045 [Balneolales bacterium]
MRPFHHFGKIITVLIVILIASTDFARAQISVEGGFSVGFNRHTFSVDDDSGILQPGLALAGTYGFPIILRNDKWELHTGFYGNDLSQSFYFNTPNGNTFGQRSFVNGISSFKIPVHFGRTIQWTDVTSLSPQLGFAWLTSQRTGMTGTSSGSYGGYVEYQTVDRAVNKNKFLAETGMDINLAIFWELNLTVGAHYSFGLQKIEEVDITYETDNQTYEGTMISRGSGWKFNLGLTLPLYRQ